MLARQTADFIINTAPVCMIDQEAMDHWKSMKTVIDLASGFPFVDSACLKHPKAEHLREYFM